MRRILCLFCVAVCLRGFNTGPVQKPRKTESMAAPLEDVNILIYGVIQFSESLQHVYDTTEAKIARISQSLKKYEGTLQELGKETEQAAEGEKQLKGLLDLLQVQMAGLQAEAEMTKDRLARVEQEEVELRTKVTSLETNINNSSPNSIKALQERAEQHSSVLKSLQHLTQYQKQHLENQIQQLSKIQSEWSCATDVLIHRYCPWNSS